jgi:hypothetical protein
VKEVRRSGEECGPAVEKEMLPQRTATVVQGGSGGGGARGGGCGCGQGAIPIFLSSDWRLGQPRLLQSAVVLAKGTAGGKGMAILEILKSAHGGCDQICWWHSPFFLSFFVPLEEPLGSLLFSFPCNFNTPVFPSAQETSCNL